MAAILTISETDKAVVVTPKVMRFDLIETDRLRDELSALISETEKRSLLIDLCEVDFLVSATLGVFAEVGDRCRATTRPLALIRLKPKVHDVFRTCSLDHVLAIHADADEALAAI